MVEDKRGKLLTLLNFRDTSHEIIKTLRLGLGSVGGEGQVVVLKVETNTRQVDFAVNSGCFEFLRVT